MKAKFCYQIPSKDKKIIEEQLEYSKKKEFPQKEFIVDGVKKLYRPYLFFTESNTIIENKNFNVEFRCILCNEKLHAPIGETRNIKRHLEKINSW